MQYRDNKSEANFMVNLINISIADWNQECSPAIHEQALRGLEEGGVLILPQLNFSVGGDEARFLSPTIVGGEQECQL